MTPVTKIITPEELLIAISMEPLKYKLLKYQELLGELKFILKSRIKPSLPKISSFLINQFLHGVDKTGLTFLRKKFNLNNNDIPHVIAMKIDIKSFLFTSRQLIDQQLLILDSLGEVAQSEDGYNQLSKELKHFIPNLHSKKYPHLNPIIENYFVSHTKELLYFRFVRNSVKTIGDLKAEMIYTPDNTEIKITVKADYSANDGLLRYLTTDKIEDFNFKLTEIFTKTIDLFALYNNLVMDLLVQQAKKITPDFEINLSVTE